MKDSFINYRRNQLQVEGIPAKTLAEAVGTPAYVYSHAAIVSHFREFDRAFRNIPHLVCYSMKCNSNLAILRLFSRLGSGIDIVSGGELFRARQAGAGVGAFFSTILNPDEGSARAFEEMNIALRNQSAELGANVKAQRERVAVLQRAIEVERQAQAAGSTGRRGRIGLLQEELRNTTKELERLQRQGQIRSPIAILEDVELSLRLARLGRPAYLDLPVTVSARRYKRVGWWKVWWANRRILRRYSQEGPAAARAIYEEYYRG